MSAKKKRFDTRTILIVLFVIVVIAAGYIVITNLPAEEEYLTPEEVLRNKDNYLNETIIVKGLYDLDGGKDVVVSTMSTVNGRAPLEIDLEGFSENETDILKTGNKYKFTGVLKLNEEDQLGVSVKLVVEKIEEV